MSHKLHGIITRRWTWGRAVQKLPKPEGLKPSGPVVTIMSVYPGRDGIGADLSWRCQNCFAWNETGPNAPCPKCGSNAG